jgi:hypothetical protein
VERKTLYLKPKDGRVVRDPRDAKPLPVYGQAVPDISYWRRRLKDGDVETTTASAIKKGAAAAVKED